MSTLQGITNPFNIGQNLPQNAPLRLPAQDVTQAAENAAGQTTPTILQAQAMTAERLTGDSQSLAFNPAQINSSDLESAHRPLDPDRVARLLGLLD